MININIYQPILIRLTEKGYQKLLDDFIKQKKDNPDNNIKQRNIDFYKSKADHNGYYKTDLNSIIYHFGAESNCLLTDYFDKNIIVINEQSNSYPFYNPKNCYASIVDNKQIVFMPDGTQIPGQVMSRVTDDVSKQTTALIKLIVNLK